MKSKIRAELAELIGILLGDGSINVYPSPKYSTFYRVKISFHADDKEYLAYVKNLLWKLLNVEAQENYRKNEKTAELLIFKKAIVEKLLKLGLKSSPKWNRAVIPEEFMNPELGKYVLRGYFDTDGSVVIANNNGTLYPRLEMKISPSPMQNQLIELLEQCDFRPNAYDIGKGKVRVQMNGKKVLKEWFERIGWSNPKHEQKAHLFLSNSFLPPLF
ncbi:hypothetical protein GOV07_02950 [Candidatus Woesearchaeota archaeon]|nr:hypothetical protein [Candidatus Woesearchaeota archaeon]